MHDFQRQFVDFMVDAGVLTFGDFVTKSGRRTPYFVNTGKYRSGAQLARLGRAYADAIERSFPQGFDCLFGPAYKGIPLVVAVSMAFAERGREVEGDALGKLPRVDEDQRAAVLLYELLQAVVDLVPVLVRADGGELAPRDFDA